MCDVQYIYHGQQQQQLTIKFIHGLRMEKGKEAKHGGEIAGWKETKAARR